MRRLGSSFVFLLGFVVGASFANGESNSDVLEQHPADNQLQRSFAGEQNNEPDLREAHSGPDCGIYSLAACLSALRVEFQTTALYKPKYIGSSEGSSARELIEAARACGAFAQGFVNLNAEDLKAAESPMILHMRGGGTRFDHWVAFLGTDGDKARILDAPHPLETISFADVLADWDGFGVSVSSAPASVSVLSEARLGYAERIIVVLLVVLLCRQLINRTASQSSDTAARNRFRVVCLQSTVLATVALMLAFTYHSFADVGFRNNPTALAEVARRYFSVDIPQRSLSELQGLIHDKDVVVVDARRASDFRLGAISGAINIPVDSSLAQRRRALRDIARTSPIVVYCQSVGCHYSDDIAEFLKFNGYANVSLFRGGYKEWQSSKSYTSGTKSVMASENGS